VSHAYPYAVAVDTNPNYVQAATLERPDIRGAAVAIPDNTFYGDLIVSEGYFQNHRNIVMYPWPHTALLAGNRFEPVPGVPLETISYDHSLYSGSRLYDDLTKPSPLGVLSVFNHNGVPGANYLLFSPQQDPNYIVPASSGFFKSGPESGLTNEQSWQRHGIAMGWQLAPCRQNNDPDGSRAKALAQSLGAAPGMLAFRNLLPSPDLKTSAPRVLVTSPVPGASYALKTVRVRFLRLGRQSREFPVMFQVDHKSSLTFDSTRFSEPTADLTGIPDGQHTLSWWLIDPSRRKIPGTEGSLRFSTFTPGAGVRGASLSGVSSRR
jgi:hypothetical protein